MIRLRSTLFIATLFAAIMHAADFPTPYDSEKGAPMPAEEAARTMELPPGFKCLVFAAEPDVQQPIAMAWDAKARLWVAENYTFAETPRRWDTSLRDRIIILEDKDGDGRHDGRKVFWDKGSYLTSVEVGYGGVWILNDGTLSFIADRNGDDVPDGEPEVLLDGFNVKTLGHNIVNGLRWGPDGWLYGRHGITDTSAVGPPGMPSDKRTKLNCSIWRYHPTRKVFEVVCHGGTNSWGHDWNEQGQLFFINTVIGHLWHAVPGAYYRRMFGAHLNPYVYEVIEQTADHFHWDTGAEKWSDLRNKPMSDVTDHLGGGHAHVGMLIYQGGAWPKEYHGAVLTCNLHGNRINVDKVERERCGYTGKHAPDLMKAKDPWFRGIELLTGPDGNVFVADWSDTGECHDNDGVHRSSGRIYKIVYEAGDAVPLARTPVDLRKVEDEELVKLLENPNNWWNRMAARQLIERHSASPALFALAQKQAGMRTSDRGAFGRMMVIHALSPRLSRAVCVAGMMEHGSPSSVIAKTLLMAYNTTATSHPDVFSDTPMVRNLEADMGFNDQASFDKWIVDLAGELAVAQETDGLVRIEIASFLQRLPLEARWPIATALALREEDSNDRQQPLMIWYGIEPAVAADPLKGVEFVGQVKIPAVRRLVARRITEEIERQPAAVDALVALVAKRADLGADVLHGMATGLEGWSKAPKPKGWDELVSSAGSGHADASIGELISQLSIVFGSGRAVDDLMNIVKDTEGDAAARRNAFASLIRAPKSELLAVARSLINDKILAVQARSSLASFDDPTVPAALLRVWPERSLEQQAATVNALISRPSYARALLDAVEAGKIPASAITPFQARHIRSLGDQSVIEKLTAVWGELRDTPEAKKAELVRWQTQLSSDALARADKGNGRTVFQTACAACHKLYGKGGALGPELTGSDRGNLNYLLENIIDPNAVVPNDYRMTVFTLNDGRVITGVVPQHTEKTITVQTPAEKLLVDRANITSSQTLPMSLMPEGLLNALTPEQARDLIGYLMSPAEAE